MGDLEKNRRLRLEQVRLQSKELAQNIRERVTSEKQKQEERIKKVKEQEMKEWKRKQFQNRGKQYTESLSLVGEAHLEAEKEKLQPAVPSKGRSKFSAPGRDALAKKKSVGTGNVQKTTTKAVQTTPREEISLTTTSSDSSSTLVDDLQMTSSSDSLEILPEVVKRTRSYPAGRQERDKVFPSEKSYFSEVTKLIKKKCEFPQERENPFNHFNGINSEVEKSHQFPKSPPTRDLHDQVFGKEPAKKVPQNTFQPNKKFNPADKNRKVESPRLVRKVHCYDHANRFHKNYIPPGNFVSKAGSSRHPNAMQNAREEMNRENYSAKLLELENIERRRLQNMRCSQALEKERLRRNYEDLLTKVDELLDREEVNENPRDQQKSTGKNEDFVSRSGDPSASETNKNVLSTKDGASDMDIDLNLMDILGKILHKLDENKVQIIEEIMSKKDEKSNVHEVIEKQKEVGVQSENLPPEQETSESTEDQVEIQTVGRSDKVEVVSRMKDSEDSTKSKKAQIQIVINVKDTPSVGNLSRIPEEEHKIVNGRRKHSTYQMNLSDVIGKKYPKTPEKKSKLLIDTVSSINSESSGSTNYHSPPSVLSNDFTQLMKGFGHGKPLEGKSSNEKEEKGPKESILRKYVTKLLEMPRAEVDLLGVSSSTEVPTPNSSVVNVPLNIAPQTESEPKGILLREESKDKEEVKKNRKNKKITTKLQVPIQSPKAKKRAESPVRSTREEKVEVIPVQRRDIEQKVNNLNGRLFDDTDVKEPDQLREKYAAYTERYMKRILKLSKLINKVRNEKNQLIGEKTVSSGSDNGLDTSTKYKDFPNMRANGSSTDVSEMKSSSFAKDDEGQFVDKTNLTACRTIGLSKDSGISISRPVTSTDMRDSPDIRWSPMKKSRPVPKVVEQEANRKVTGSSHELSTIVEMDTSRLHTSSMMNSQSKVEEAFRDLKDAIDLISKEFEYQKFPSFDEYEQRLTDKLQQSTDGASECERKLLEYFKELSQEMIYQKFPAYQELVQQEERNGAKKLDLDVASDNGASDFTLPDVVAELIKRNVMDHGFENPPEDNSASKESAAPPKPLSEEKSDKRKAEASNHDIAASSSGSSINLEADFRRVGLRWAASMLEKTHERQQLSSSDSSTQLNMINPKLRASLNLTRDENSFVDRNIARNGELDETQTKPLNLMEFLNRELEKDSNKDNSYSADGSTLTNTLLRSLIDSDLMIDVSGKVARKGNNAQRTSTPVAGSKGLKSSSSLTISSESKLSSIESIKD